MLAPRIFRSRKRRFLQICVNVVTVLVTLELLTSVWLPEMKDGLQFDPDIGYRDTSGVDKMVHSGESGLNFRYRTNSLGFRGREWAEEAPPGVKRVAVFGHSFTHGLSYPHEKTFCGLLEQHLNEAGTPFEWDVMNCGFSGCNVIAQWQAFELLIKHHKPDLVICCFAVSNNVTSNSHRFVSAKWPSAEIDTAGELLIHPPAGRAGHDLRNRSRFHVWQKKKVQSAIDRIRDPLRERWFLPDDNPSERPSRDLAGLVMTDTRPDADIAQAWTITSEILDRFRESVEESGAQFVLVSIPMAWQVYRDLYDVEREQSGDPHRYEWDLADQKLQTVLDELAIETLDLIPSFRAACPSQSIETADERLYLNGDGHFNAAGHQLVATELARFLLKQDSAVEPEDRWNSDRLATRHRDPLR